MKTRQAFRVVEEETSPGAVAPARDRARSNVRARLTPDARRRPRVPPGRTRGRRPGPTPRLDRGGAEAPPCCAGQSGSRGDRRAPGRGMPANRVAGLAELRSSVRCAADRARPDSARVLSQRAVGPPEPQWHAWQGPAPARPYTPCLARPDEPCRHCWPPCRGFPTPADSQCTLTVVRTDTLRVQLNSALGHTKLICADISNTGQSSSYEQFFLSLLLAAHTLVKIGRAHV